MTNGHFVKGEADGTFMNAQITPLPDPISAMADANGAGVLAVITGVDGPSYRPLGACMTIMTDGHRAGSLSSGCIEADVSLHATQCLKTGQPKTLLYGRGSPFVDIQLPCGGGLQITLIPNPDAAVLKAIQTARIKRQAISFTLAPDSGALAIAPPAPTGWIDGQFVKLIEPELQFFIFGKGPEASTFAAMAKSCAFETLLLSPDQETRDFAAHMGCATQALDGMTFPTNIQPDARSAIILFFHDHEWEPPILMGALNTPAFYIGAQGSQRARDLRHAEMTALGAKKADIARLYGPIGLMPSARDARSLAVSVLAEVLTASRLPAR